MQSCAHRIQTDVATYGISDRTAICANPQTHHTLGNTNASTMTSHTNATACACVCVCVCTHLCACMNVIQGESWHIIDNLCCFDP